MYLCCRYGWRYQIKPWVSLGYRVVVPDKLGYGGTDKPEDAVHYTPKRISDDVAALMDLLGIPKAVSMTFMRVEGAAHPDVATPPR